MIVKKVFLAVFVLCMLSSCVPYYYNDPYYSQPYYSPAYGSYSYGYYPYYYGGRYYHYDYYRHGGGQIIINNRGGYHGHGYHHF